MTQVLGVVAKKTAPPTRPRLFVRVNDNDESLKTLLRGEILHLSGSPATVFLILKTQMLLQLVERIQVWVRNVPTPSPTLLKSAADCRKQIARIQRRHAEHNVLPLAQITIYATDKLRRPRKFPSLKTHG
jgi:hypothetical protein